MELSEKVKLTTVLLGDKILEFEKEGRGIYATSSFQTQSVPLLHILGKNFPSVKVIFLDTGFLFPETYSFKRQLEKELLIQTITVNPTISKHLQIDGESKLFQYSIDADKCCALNKVDPLNGFWNDGDVWISGVRRDQSAVRKQMNVIEQKEKVIKFHPMLDWNSKDIYDYIRLYGLPKHPLEQEGYISIGCVPCTHKWTVGSHRGGRWLGSQKTECGLHLSK